MKVAEVRKLSVAELADQANKLREEIAGLKRRVLQGEVQNVRLVKSRRKDLARVLTVMGEQLDKENM